jgi:hypothetical protein
MLNMLLSKTEAAIGLFKEESEKALDTNLV